MSRAAGNSSQLGTLNATNTGENRFSAADGPARGKLFTRKKCEIAVAGIERVHRAANRQITFHCHDVITDSGVALITGTADG